MSATIQLKFGSLALDSTNNITIASISEKCDKPVTTTNIPKADGAIAEEAKLGPKTITIEGDIAGTSYENLRTNIQSLKSGLMDGIQNLTKDDERYIACQCKSFSYEYYHLTIGAKWTAQFVAHYPFWLSQTLNTDTRLPVSGTGYTITNAGNAPTRIKVQVTAQNPTFVCQFDGADAATAYTAETGETVTFVGTAQLDTAQSALSSASSLLLDGNSDNITVPDSANWNFGTGSFTIHFWIRFASLTDAQIMASQYEDGDNYWYLKKDTNANGNKLSMKFVDGASTKGDYVMSGAWSGVATNTWYHLTFVRNSTAGLIFIDGTSQTLTENTAFSTNNTGDIADTLVVGCDGNAGNYVNGWIDEVVIFKGTAVWTASFTKPASQTETSIADNCQIENTTRGELCVYRGTVSGGNALVIDNRVASDDFVVTNNSSSDFQNFEGDFLNLSSGANSVELTGTQGTTVVSWRDAWY